MLEIRELLRLHYEVHLSNWDIARALQITHGTVGQCLQRFEVAGGTWPLGDDVLDKQLRQWLYQKETSLLVPLLWPTFRMSPRKKSGIFPPNTQNIDAKEIWRERRISWL